jgi:hypothetical protein
MSSPGVIKAAGGRLDPSIVRLGERLASSSNVSERGPTPQEQEITALKHALACARAENQKLQDTWQEKFVTAIDEARSEIAEQFVRDDAAYVAALASAAEEGLIALRKSLVEPAETMAIELAARALARFGLERASDGAFVADVVCAEVNRFDEAMVLAVQISPGASAESSLVEKLRDQLPVGVQLEPMSEVPKDTVRIKLRLGHVDIDCLSAVRHLRDQLIVEFNR